MSFKEKLVYYANKVRTPLLKLGIIGIILWWTIKAILCFFFGICIPF